MCDNFMSQSGSGRAYRHSEMDEIEERGSVKSCSRPIDNNEAGPGCTFEYVTGPKISVLQHLKWEKFSRKEDIFSFFCSYLNGRWRCRNLLEPSYIGNQGSGVRRSSGL